MPLLRFKLMFLYDPEILHNTYCKTYKYAYCNWRCFFSYLKLMLNSKKKFIMLLKLPNTLNEYTNMQLKILLFVQMHINVHTTWSCMIIFAIQSIVKAFTVVYIFTGYLYKMIVVLMNESIHILYILIFLIL